MSFFSSGLVPRARGSIFSALILIGAISCTQVPRDPITIPRDAAVIERGKELVRGLASCGFCHGRARSPDAPLSGGLPFHDRYGEVKAANITSDRMTGIGSTTTTDLYRVLRGGWATDDRHISLDVHRGYEWMADDDLAAIVAYLRTVPPVVSSVERRSVGWYGRNVVGFFEGDHEVRGYIPTIPRRFQADYGKYLVENVARCGVCHDGVSGLLSDGASLAGGKTIHTESGERTAPSLLRRGGAGISRWSESSIVKFLKKGETPNGKGVDKRFCPVNFYREAKDDDLMAIATYLRSLGN